MTPLQVAARERDQAITAAWSSFRAVVRQAKKDGASVVAIAGELGVSRQRVYQLLAPDGGAQES